MSRFYLSATLVALMGAVCHPWAEAKIGLSSQFMDAVIENIRPGRVYNLRELRGVPYTIKNRGDGKITVLIEVSPPSKGQLKENYEPIPDPSWIRVVPERHEIPKKSMAFSDIIIQLPDDETLNNRHFQAMIWAHTVGTGMLAAGVLTRIRFSTGLGPESLEEEKRRKAMVTLNFDIWPQAMYVVRAKAGKKYNVKKKEKKSLKITNRSDENLKLVLKSIPWNPRFGLPEGYEVAPDPGYMYLKPSNLKLKANSVKEVKLYFRIPEEHKGKKLAFLIQASLPIGTPVSASNRVYVTVLGDEK